MAHYTQAAPACVGKIGVAAATSREFVRHTVMLWTRGLEAQTSPLNHPSILGVRPHLQPLQQRPKSVPHFMVHSTQAAPCYVWQIREADPATRQFGSPTA